MNDRGPALNRDFFLGPDGWPYLLVPFIPLAIGLDIAGASAGMIFFAAAIGIIPTAALMGRATEELAERSGPGIGGLLNVTFGNAPELIIALFALAEGLQEVVKASIIGSIIGNVLLVLGAAMVSGGIGRPGEVQKFDRTAASSQSTMLFLAAAALLMPAIFELVEGRGLPSVGPELVDYGSTVELLSLAVSGVLILCYIAGLFFSLNTHSDVFNPRADGHGGGGAEATGEATEVEADDSGDDTWGWSIRTSVIALAIAGVAVGVMSEVLVGSITEASESIGLSEFFIGAIVVAIVGNAAEHWVAVLVAFKGKMDLAVNIAIGSSAQVALFVAPALVFASFLIGPSPMPLVFNGFELGAILLAALIANAVTSEGESTWFEGVQLLAVYAVFAIAFFAA
ncbi:MAG: calcium/proton exchanger [Solirubrobacterales bacterium]